MSGNSTRAGRAAPRLDGLEGAHLDVVVVGGGIAGAGIARDLALRGISVALFEKRDFGSGTTSRSSKLLHGGLRYLERGDVRLVRESLRERATLRRLAPHLIRPLPFLVPVYRESTRSLLRVRVGLRLYDWLAPDRKGERPRVLEPVDALALEPGIRPENLRGAGYYCEDLLLWPERLCLENVLSACRHAARAFNYCEVEEVVRGPRGIEGVRVRDLLSDRVATVMARVVVNAAGPWVDRVRELAQVADNGRRVTRTTKGIHCLLPRLTERAVYHSTRDGRMVLVVPWRDFSLVGTTDTDFDGDPDRVEATRDEVAYLLDEVRRVLPGPRVTEAEVAYSYAGVRPLARDERGRPSDASRVHRIVTEAGGTLLSITGAKLTTFRSLAEEVGDLVSRALGRRAPSRTAMLSLDGADEEIAPAGVAAGDAGVATAREPAPDVAQAARLSTEALVALVATYGRAYPRVVELVGKVPDGGQRLCPQNPEVVAQLHHAVGEEHAISLGDILLRRTGIGTSRCQGTDCAESIGRRMAALLGWTPRRLAAELDAWDAHVARSRRFRSAVG
jgi:glycerol-3-phosphate dehydrogenase